MLDTGRISTLLNHHHPGWKIHYYPSVTSTNTAAWDLYKQGLKSNLIIITDNQTSGRGRGKHTWHSQPGEGLTFSILLQPDLSADQAGLIPIIAGVSVAEAIKKLNIPAYLKWPNDILINSRKTGGILCESRIAGSDISAAVIGIGLNVNDELSSYPEEIRTTATSLYQSTGITHDREDLLIAVFTSLERNLRDYSVSEIVQEWNRSGALINKSITMVSGNSTINGKFKGINGKGEAILEINGELNAYASGEIKHFREAK